MLLVPSRAHSSTPKSNSLDIILMKRRTTNSQVTPLPNRNNLGVSFREEAGGEAMAEVVPAHHIFQRLPGVPSSTNDNQCFLHPPVQLSLSQGDISQCQS